MFLDLCADIAADATLSNVIRTIYNGIRIAVPVILIIVGMVEMGKAIASQKEDEIKKAQSALIKKAVAAVLVFLMFSIVKIVISAVGGSETEKTCLDQILNGAQPTQEQKQCDNNLASTKATECSSQGKGMTCNPSTGIWECK